jgi:hypothetical protein
VAGRPCQGKLMGIMVLIMKRPLFNCVVGPWGGYVRLLCERGCCVRCCVLLGMLRCIMKYCEDLGDLETDLIPNSFSIVCIIPEFEKNAEGVRQCRNPVDRKDRKLMLISSVAVHLWPETAKPNGRNHVSNLICTKA